MTQTFYTYGDTNEPDVSTQLEPIKASIGRLIGEFDDFKRDSIVLHRQHQDTMTLLAQGLKELTDLVESIVKRRS